MYLSVIVASLGRPKELSQLSQHLSQQSRKPDEVIFSVVSEADLPDRSTLYKGAKIIFSPKGSCIQRNKAIDAAHSDSDFLVFLDDDYLPTSTTLEDIETFFDKHDDCVGVTGHLIADGINSPGISYTDAVEMLANHRPAATETVDKTLEGLYGCNMAYRSSAIGHYRFDENLPLYGWQEDIDFAASVRGQGKLAKTSMFAGVHRGAKGARTSGVRLGYSQIVNPHYLVRKGTMARSFAIKIAMRNFIANHVKAIKPEPWVDRAGRVKGNWLGLKDIITGQAKPSNILEL